MSEAHLWDDDGKMLGLKRKRQRIRIWMMSCSCRQYWMHKICGAEKDGGISDEDEVLQKAAEIPLPTDELEEAGVVTTSIT